MATASKWKPWHEVVQLRDELKTGELSLSMFAADLDEVILKKGKRPIYEAPAKFFGLTYPTYNLRNLARDVVRRLAGKSDKAVRQLNLTYGGGKTHTLITLFHLVNDPATLPDLPAVEEFRTHIDLGNKLPKARVAAISFRKLPRQVDRSKVELLPRVTSPQKADSSLSEFARFGSLPLT